MGIAVNRCHRCILCRSVSFVAAAENAAANEDRRVICLDLHDRSVLLSVCRLIRSRIGSALLSTSKNIAAHISAGHRHMRTAKNRSHINRIFRNRIALRIAAARLAVAAAKHIARNITILHSHSCRSALLDDSRVRGDIDIAISNLSHISAAEHISCDIAALSVITVPFCLCIGLAAVVFRGLRLLCHLHIAGSICFHRQAQVYFHRCFICRRRDAIPCAVHIAQHLHRAVLRFLCKYICLLHTAETTAAIHIARQRSILQVYVSLCHPGFCSTAAAIHPTGKAAGRSSSHISLYIYIRSVHCSKAVAAAVNIRIISVFHI